jgi:acyl-CoA reductase-like NAD-dependent aldehyde dehydrogenase
MGAPELWVEAYQGEVLGETLFGLLAQREADPVRRHQLEMLTLLERSTKELAEPVFEMGRFDRGDTAATVESAAELAEAVSAMSWSEFLESFEPVTKQFLAKYRELVELSADETECRIAEAYVAHEEALAAFARRALGDEDGEPLQLILALPHVAAALAA